jgi:hypothetical protein
LKKNKTIHTFFKEDIGIPFFDERTTTYAKEFDLEKMKLCFNVIMRESCTLFKEMMHFLEEKYSRYV